VAGEPVGDLVPAGVVAKASRFRWTQSLDWGSGAPSARSCVGYFVMGEFDPVNVVFSYPAETDRLADIEALMATFVVLGNPVVRLPPGSRRLPRPRPSTSWRPPRRCRPMPTYHADPGLEALLPDSIDGRTLTKESRTGEQMGMTDADPILPAFGKHPSDIASASASAAPAANQPLLIIAVDRLRGVPADQLLAAMLKSIPADEVSHTSLDGRQVTYVVHGAWPVWYYATGDLVYGIALADENTAARVLADFP
jgi:hypothetical protein